MNHRDKINGMQPFPSAAAPAPTQTFFAGVLTGLLLSASGLYGYCAGFFSAMFVMQKLDPWQLLHSLVRDHIIFRTSSA